MEIKPTIANIGKNSINTLNEVGRATLSTVNTAKNAAIKHIPNDTFKKVKDAGIGKETAVGVGVSAAALALAIKCVKEIRNSLKSVKQN